MLSTSQPPKRDRLSLHSFSIRDLLWLLTLTAVLTAWGVAFGAYHWILSVLTEHVATTGTVMLSVLPLILGFQLILQAIVLDIQESPK